MMTYFFTAQGHIPPGLGFSLFGGEHLFWLAGIAAAIGCLCPVCRRMSPRARGRLYLGLALGALSLDGLWDLVLLATGQFAWNYLPLDLCGLAMFAELLWALRRGRLLGELCYGLFLPGAVMALIFPNWTPLPAWNLLYLRSFLLHGLLVAQPVLAVAAGDLRPDARNLPKCLGIALALCVPVYAVDKALDQNFFFLNTPSPGSPLELFAAWLGEPGYLLGLPVMLALVWLLLYGVPGLVRSLYRKKDLSP